MKLCFVVADVSAQMPRFATVKLARAAARRGHDVALTSIGDLTLEPGGAILAEIVRTADPCADDEAFAETITRSSSKRDAVDLRSFDVVFLRYNPHREGRGVSQSSNPGLDFGARLKAAGLLVVNDPEGAHTAGGRMYVSALAKEVRPRSLVTRSPEQIKRFLRELEAPAVVKPLGEAGTGIEEVFYVARGQVKNLNQIISVVRKSGYALVQEYLPEAENGEQRLLLVDGRPLTAGGEIAIYRRKTPALADAPPHFKRAPVAKRGTRVVFGEAEQRIVDALGPHLRSDGLFYVAVDIVGDKVLGVNVHTPGGLHNAQDLYGQDFAGEAIAGLERRLSEHARANRRIAS